LPITARRICEVHRRRALVQVATSCQAPATCLRLLNAQEVFPANAPSSLMTAGRKPLRLRRTEQALASAPQIPTKLAAATKKTSLGRYVPCSVRIELMSLPERLQGARKSRQRNRQKTEPFHHVAALLHISLWRSGRENRRRHLNRLDGVTNGHGVLRMSGSRFGMRPHSRAEGHQLEKFTTSFVGGW
jgi:hypothetical protein